MSEGIRVTFPEHDLAVTAKPIEYVRGDSDCWVVVSHSSAVGGYPMLRRRGSVTAAHRHVFKECYGPIPQGETVRHTCGKRNCINPEHLELGMPSGSSHYRSKVTEEQAAEIRVLSAMGWSPAQLAKTYGISAMRVRSVLRARSWNHLEHGQKELKTLGALTKKLPLELARDPEKAKLFVRFCKELGMGDEVR